MKKIPVDKIENGMILSKPLIGASGNVLLNEGVVLKTTMIPRLKNWDIPFVTVQGEEEKTAEAAAPLAQEFETKQLDQVFADVLTNPLMKIIYDATLLHLRGKQAANG
jgi:hypothetical protein